ncbi:MAG: O-antigen ligase family protein [Firmicutes bacterium]|nr:O-antigen ligase family protein [Bacillota bacterium]
MIKINSKNSFVIKFKPSNIEYAIFKYLWIIIILPKALQFLVYVALLLIIGKQNRIHLHIFSKIIIIMSIIQLIAVVMQCIINDPDKSRIFAAINTSLIWVLAAIFYSVFRYRNNLGLNELKTINRYIIINFIILFAVYALSLFSKKNVYTIAGMNLVLRKADYLSTGVTTRFCGFMDTVLCPSHMFIFSFPLYVYSAVSSRTKPWLLFLFGVFSFVPIFATHSRIGTVICLSQLVILLGVIFNNSKIRVKHLVCIFATVIILFFVLTNFNYIKSNFWNFFNSRDGSNSTRFSIYHNSIKKAWTESPFIGMGIKYMFGKYPYGSHCTYIGIFYKTGILGLCVFVTAFFILYTALFKNLKYSVWGKGIFLMLVVYMFFLVFADLDATNWIVLSFFSVCGLMSNKNLGSTVQSMHKRNE